jgi:hypothetical protein
MCVADLHNESNRSGRGASRSTPDGDRSMTFSYEHQMMDPVAQWLRDHGLMVKMEFPTPWGICDLVGCSLNKKKVQKRLSQHQTRPIGSLLRVHLLSLIPDQKEGGSVNAEDLHRAFAGYLDKDRIGHELMKLMKDRFIETTDTGTFYKINGWMPLHRRLVAVELKLSRIDDALHQAINNLGFADESYVALPVSIAERLVNRQKESQFANKGVGLLGVDPQGCRIVLKASTHRVRQDAVVQEHSVERFWLPHVRGSGA